MPARPSRNVKSNKAVLDALQQLNHATAQEIFDWIRRSPKGKGLSLTSVYRALNQLTASSQIKPLNFNDGQVRYELNTQQMHHHHFVCTQCNGITVVDICPYEQIAKQLSESFYIQYHNFEIFGLCDACHTQVPAGPKRDEHPVLV